MPNWCMNVVTFRHEDPSEISKLHDAAIDGKLFSAFFPCPAELQETTSPNTDGDKSAELIEKYGFADWYSWQVSNWGTKWDTGSSEEYIELSEGGKSITVTFDTAWTPPIEFFEKMEGELGWKITAYYHEPGMAFVGKWDESFDVSYTYSDHSSEDVRDVIGEELDDMFCISENMAEMEENDE